MTLPLQKKCVGLLENPPGNRYGFLFDTLGQLFPVEFKRVSSDGLAGLDAVIALDGDTAAGLAAAANGLPVLVVGKEDEKRATNGSQPVRFGETQDLEACLRNQVMMEKDGAGHKALDDNLHHPGRDLRERSFQAGVRETSLYSTAQMRPKATFAIALLAGLAAGAALFGAGRSGRGGSSPPQS